MVRNGVVPKAKMKYDRKGAPAYAYYFIWQSPMLEDVGAWHTAELAFCFDNDKRCEEGTETHPRRRDWRRRWRRPGRISPATEIQASPAGPGLPPIPFAARRSSSIIAVEWWMIRKAKCARFCCRNSTGSTPGRLWRSAIRRGDYPEAPCAGSRRCRQGQKQGLHQRRPCDAIGPTPRVDFECRLDAASRLCREPRRAG